MKISCTIFLVNEYFSVVLFPCLFLIHSYFIIIRYNKENALPKSCIIMVWAILASEVCNPRLPPPESILSKVHSQISVK